MACLAEFGHVKIALKNAKKTNVDALHKFVFESEGDRGNRNRLREFAGFNYCRDDPQFAQKREYARQNLSSADLVSICVLLGLEYGGANVMLFIFENLRAQQLLKDIGEAESDADDDDDDGDQGSVKTVDQSQQEQSVVAQSQQEEAVKELDNCSAVSVASYQVQQRGKISSRFSLNFRDVEDTVRKFDASGKIYVEVWLEEFEEIAAMMEWDQLQMFIFAKQSLKGLAKMFVAGERGLNSWCKLRAGLLEEFSQKVNSALMQYVIDGIRDLHSNKAMLYGARTITDFKDKIAVYEQFSKKQKSYSKRHEKETAQTSIGEVKKEATNIT